LKRHRAVKSSKMVWDGTEFNHHYHCTCHLMADDIDLARPKLVLSKLGREVTLDKLAGGCLNQPSPKQQASQCYGICRNEVFALGAKSASR